MNYKKMWSRMKSEMMKEAENKGCSSVRREYLERSILRMVKIETEERELDEESPHEYEYAIHQDITGGMDFKVSGLAKEARKMFEQITGHKVIDSLEELESEIQKKKGNPLLCDVQEPIVVDEKVEIPSFIYHEADVHGIRIARFGVDVVSTDALPKGVFMRKETSYGFPG